MEALPLSSDEEAFLRSLIGAFRDAAREHRSSPDEPVLRQPWWEADPVTVTEVASDWGGVGRGEPIATFHRPTELLLAHASRLTDQQASSLLIVDSARGLLAARFRQYKKKRATLRFLVGRAGRRGSVWRLWAGVTDDDIYLGDRHSAKLAKFRLHASGDYRLQWNTQDRTESPFWSRDGSNPAGRVMASWGAPPPGPAGWTHVLSVNTTAEDVVRVPGDNQSHGAPVCVPRPQPGWMVEVAIYVVAPDGVCDMSHRLIPDGAAARLLGGYLLPSGRTVMAWAFTQPMPPGMAEMLAQQREATRERHRDTQWNLHPSSGPRAMAMHKPGEGEPMILWDLAIADFHIERREGVWGDQ